MKKRCVASLLLCICLIFVYCPIETLAIETYPYINENGQPASISIPASNVIDEDWVESWGESSPVSLSGWYVVTDTSGIALIMKPSLKVSGEVFLILADGAHLVISDTANNEPGIRLEGSNSLTIYGQAEGTGMLTAMGYYNAGIGGDGGGTLTVYGGYVRGIGTRGGAGIGGSSGKDGCTVNIYGGKVLAISRGDDSAGMGGGYSRSDYTSGNGGTVNIYGGEVTAEDDGNGAGIGGSYRGHGGTVNIYGGTVEAKSDVGGAGIGSGEGGHGGTVNIHGGVVTAESVYCPGIGGCSGGTVNITGGVVTAIGYELGAAIGSCRNSDVPIAINISGGTVIAKGGWEGVSGGTSGVGIGGGVGSVGGIVNISGGSVLAKGLSSGYDIFGTLRNRSDEEEVYLTTVTMKNAADLPIDAARISSLTTTLGGAAYAYGITDMAADEEGKLYLYLPANAETVAVQTTDSAVSPPRKNYYGCVLTTSMGSSGTLTLDTVLPTVTSVNPDRESVPASIDKFSITFSEAMDEATVGTVILSEAGTLSNPQWSNGNKTVTYALTGLLPRTGYTVDISGFRDETGNWMEPASGYGFQTLDNDAALADLSISQGTLSPAFSGNILQYKAFVDNNVESFTIMPTARSSGASIQINGIPVSSGVVSSPIALQVGTNVISITVTAEDGCTQQTYTLKVTKYRAVYEPELRTLSDIGTGLTVSGRGIPAGARLLVSSLELHSSDVACQAIRRAQAQGQLILGYDIRLSQSYHGDITVTFPVGSQYNGQTVSLLHCVDGSLEALSATVDNGVVRFAVDSLSPFAVVQSLYVPDTVIVKPPKTGDATMQTGYFLLALSALCICLRLSKLWKVLNQNQFSRRTMPF